MTVEDNKALWTGAQPGHDVGGPYRLGEPNQLRHDISQGNGAIGTLLAENHLGARRIALVPAKRKSGRKTQDDRQGLVGRAISFHSR